MAEPASVTLLRPGGKVALALAVILLSGCAATLVAPQQEAHQTLTVGTFYAFYHPGGRMVLGVEPGGFAQVELFAPDDTRLGQVLLGGAGRVAPIAFDEMPAGDFVMRALSLDGNLSVANPDGHPSLRPLVAHVERHVLVQKTHNTLSIPFGNAEENSPIALDLLRTATSLRLLSDATYERLEVHLAGRAGPVLEARDANPIAFGPLVSNNLFEVPSDRHPENLRDGHLSGTLQVAGLSGVIVLEAESYSRAEPERALAKSVVAPAFTYGELPQRPVRAELATNATRIILTTTTSAAVAFFLPDGTRLGLVELVNQSVAVAVPGRAVVAVLLAGQASLGADVAPVDFTLSPLNQSETTSPAPAGGNGEYRQDRFEITALGVAYEVGPVSRGGMPFPCSGNHSYRVSQHGETLGMWREGQKPDPIGPWLTGNSVTVDVDGFGSNGCATTAVVLRAWIPATPAE